MKVLKKEKKKKSFMGQFSSVISYMYIGIEIDIVPLLTLNVISNFFFFFAARIMKEWQYSWEFSYFFLFLFFGVCGKKNLEQFFLNKNVK